ncbi:MAG: response regulator transcription factor [Chloroflexi bacterium]|nr:response regulator transcription factor [Chloroflexota bacterium]
MPLLRSVGYTARIAEDGDAALEILKDAHPLAIIVGGAANLNLYCTLRRAARIPILALVPESDRDRALSAFAVGVDDYQSSPIGSREIVTRVGALLRSIHRKSPSIQTSL